MVDEQCSVVI